jgi:cytochrome c oxidase assembly protein subunit 15
MIVVGGVTRLTQSGLSMVDWQPIMGVIPPVSSEEWQSAFDDYKQYPEYQKINRGMSLDEFKGIFYWEYGHRVLGRVIGLVYFLPFVAFLLMKRIERRWIPWLWGGFILGGLQGLMGWYMVTSGLVDNPHVSHYRLAAHLMLAIFIVAYLFWLMLDMAGVSRLRVTSAIRGAALLLLGLLTLQLVLGAFVAGLDAGRGFNTWPLMHGQFLADAASMMAPFYQNFLENGVMIQFVHRWLGALILLGVVLFLFLAWHQPALVLPCQLLVVTTALQFTLGVLTLLQAVPVGLGSLHQAVAVLMVLALVFIVYRVTGKPAPA